MRVSVVFCLAAASALSVAATEHDARACGGCFIRGQSGTVVTDHQMIFSVSTQQTTLYDEIQYSGSPSSFAWVLPIHGQVSVGLSSDVVFGALEQTTQTNIYPPPLPPCLGGGGCFCPGALGDGLDAGSVVVNAVSGGVSVLAQQTIGPYETVQLQSADPNALNAWLAANGYDIPANIQPTIAAYVAEGFDFLVMKLAPGQGVQAMRSVRVTTPGGGVSLPLRMVAAGTGVLVGITLWVIADGSYEPKNFQHFTISPSELTWDWSMSSSDYATVRTRKEVSFNNTAWQIESTLSIPAYAIETLVLQSQNDYTLLSAADGGPSGQTPAQAQLEDLGVLFPEGNGPVRITRLRSDLARAALATDLVLQAAADQTVVSNLYQVTNSVNAPACPAQLPCNCGGTSSSGSSLGRASNGASGSVGSSGPGGSSGATAAPASADIPPLPTRHVGCTVSPSYPGSDIAPHCAVGLVALALMRTQRRARARA
jgi:hypothetical protein